MIVGMNWSSALGLVNTAAFLLIAVLAYLLIKVRERLARLEGRLNGRNEPR